MHRVTHTFTMVLLAAATLATPAQAATVSVAPGQTYTLSADAAAALAVSVQDALDRGAQYWGSAPACQNGVQVIYDQQMTGGSGAMAESPGCRVWIGDSFIGRFSQLERCRDLVHEWDHLLGHDHSPAGDPDDVMPYQHDARGYDYINTARTCNADVTVTADADAMVAAAWDAKQAAAAAARAAVAVPEPAAAQVAVVARVAPVKGRPVALKPARKAHRVSSRVLRERARRFARRLHR